MSKKIQAGLLMCVYVGIVVAVMEALWLFIPQAANGQNLVIAGAGCAAGVLFGVAMVILCGVAAKQVFGPGEAAPEESHEH